MIINGIEYEVVSEDGQTTVTWANGSVMSNLTEADALELVVLNHLQSQIDKALSKSDWRMSIDYPHDDQEAWIEYRDKLRKLTSTYVQGEDISLPTKPT